MMDEPSHPVTALADRQPLPAGRRPSGRADAVCLLLVLFALLGVLRALPNPGTIRRAFTAPAGFRVDDLYRDLLRLLPEDVPVGFLSDKAPAELGYGDHELRFMRAQYAVAPRPLHDHQQDEYIIADVSSSACLDELCARQHLQIVERTPQGLALLRKAVGSPD